MKNDYIYYGNGKIRINYSEDILGFDIRLKGTYDIESHQSENFYISYNNDRLIGVGLGSVLGGKPFLNYTGHLEVLECKIITSDMKSVNIIPKIVRLDKFEAIRDDFDGSNTNFEDMNNVGIVGEIPRVTKVKIATENLYTKGGQFNLNGTEYKGYYHLHQDGVAMTGKSHNESSEVLDRISKEKTTKRINNTLREIRRTSTSADISSGTGGGY